MSLSSSLFSGISGLSTLGNAMTVIGDNIANVNTVGFKASRVTFQDVLSQSVATVSGSAQVGRGTAMTDISSSFSQGSFESTDNTTDLAIGGDGFFVVRDPTNINNLFYTRAGEFRFDKDGNFINPAGFIVKGWALNASTGQDEGSITDIVLQSFTSAPAATTSTTVITNLDADQPSQSSDLADAWNGGDSNGSYITENAYEYQTTLKVYDSLGSTHDVTLYFDKGNTSEYEFIVTVNPGEDNRTGFGLSSTDEGKGMLAKGVLTFNDVSGKISGMTFSRFNGDSVGVDLTTQLNVGTSRATLYHNPAETPAAEVYTFTVPAGTVGGASAIAIPWTDAGVPTTGTLTIPANYTIGKILDSTNGAPNGMEFTFTAGSLTNTDTFVATVAAGDADTLGSAYTWQDMSTAQLISDNGHHTYVADFLGGTNTTMSIELDFGSVFNNTNLAWVNGSLSTTQFSAASTTTFQTADGYGAGDLQSVTVNTDGALTGQYSNGQVIPLYRVALAKFQNVQALFKEGGNLFRATRLSGTAITNKPGTNGLGSISPNSLEQSNVDIAQEFVKMITTQRGYQANSKIITVTDQMLAELINLKR